MKDIENNCEKVLNLLPQFDDKVNQASSKRSCLYNSYKQVHIVNFIFTCILYNLIFHNIKADSETEVLSPKKIIRSLQTNKDVNF